MPAAQWAEAQPLSPGVFQGLSLEGAGGRVGRADVLIPPLGKEVQADQEPRALGSPTTKTFSSSAVSSSASPLTARWKGQVTAVPTPTALAKDGCPPPPYPPPG